MQANIHFQAALQQAKSWKTQAEKHKKDLNVSMAKLEEAQEAIKEKDELFAKAQAELVGAREEKEVAIDKYMDSEEYQELMVKHDALLFPVNFSEGWNAALKAVLEKHPGLFTPGTDFPCPQKPTALQELIGVGEESEDAGDSSEAGDRILDPNRSPLRPRDDASESSSKSEEDSGETKSGESESGESESGDAAP